MVADTEVKALGEAKAVIGRLIAGIEGHHATSACDDSGIWALANREYKALDMIRDAITGAATSQYQERHYEDVARFLSHVSLMQPRALATPEMKAQWWVNLFAADNPLFDRERFLKACGLEDA